jgi:uncharacterized protein
VPFWRHFKCAQLQSAFNCGSIACGFVVMSETIQYTPPPFTEKLKDDLVRRILSVVPPEQIVLFGSAARNEMTRDSDVDILVLIENLKDKRKTWWEIKQAFWGFPLPVDILVMDKARYEATKDVVGGMAYPVSREGVMVYEK